MIFDKLRVYDADRFYDMDLPDWYRQAERLSEAERLDWHLALDRMLECEHLLLTEEGASSNGLEIRFWQSSHGIFVVIESDSGLVEQLLVVNVTDWLPFLTTYITPLIAATAQAALAGQVHKLTNAFISFARHGEGSHVDRYSGLSRIDRDNDDRAVKEIIFRNELARRFNKEDPA